MILVWALSAKLSTLMEGGAALVVVSAHMRDLKKLIVHLLGLKTIMISIDCLESLLKSHLGVIMMLCIRDCLLSGRLVLVIQSY